MQIFECVGAAEGQACPRGISPLLGRLLRARGCADAAAMAAFLHPDPTTLLDPYLFQDMDRAVARLQKAIATGERICVFGDYDVDGVCAVSMLLLCLREMGAAVEYRIPSRQEEGYGLSLAAVDKMADEGVRLIVTVDNGVKSHAEAERCYERGMELIITDHHLCGDTLPRAEAVVCHTRPDETYPNRDICGAGTVYKLVTALMGEAAKQYLPLAGLATVADVVRLLGENRTLVHAALIMMNAGECPLGLRVLGARLGLTRAFTARDFAFGLAPRLNAAGRLESAALGVELLCCEDPARAEDMADALCALNEERQKQELAICTEAFAMIDAQDLTDKRTIVLKGDWNSGVIGIAASRVAERYYRPTMLFSEKEGLLTGSARSIPGVHLYAALLQCGSLMTRFGGHAAAAGASVLPEEYDRFCAAFEQAVRAIAPADVFLPRQSYEIEADLSEVDLGLAVELARLAPFGEGNPYPRIRTRDVYLRGLRRMGDGSHLRGSLGGGTALHACTLFGMGARMEELLAYARCDALYTPVVNEWNGARSLQLQIKAVRPCLPRDTAAYAHAHAGKFVDAFSHNILYNKSHECAVRRVDPALWLREAVSARATGVLALCFTEAGAARMLADEAVYARMDVGFFCEPKGPCAYHAAVLAPVLGQMSPARYRSVLVYDTPVTPGVLAALGELAPQAEILVGEGDPSPVVAALRFTRESMVPLYKALREAGRGFYNRAELADYLAAKTHMPPYLCTLGVDVMAELGFVREDKGLHFDPNAAAPLTESETYRALQALQTQEA